MSTLVARSVAALGLMFCAIPAATANVIYDVVVSYDNFQYAFSMAFANSSGTKTADDLISTAPEKDFLNETFTHPGETWLLELDGGLNSMSFNPGTSDLSFFSGDVFRIVPSPGTVDAFPNAAFLSHLGVSFVSDLGIVGDSVASTGMSIIQRSVPEPGTVALLGLGLAGLGAMRRKTRVV